MSLYLIDKAPTFYMCKNNILSKSLYSSITIVFNIKIQIIQMEILQYLL